MSASNVTAWLSSEPTTAYDGYVTTENSSDIANNTYYGDDDSHAAVVVLITLTKILYGVVCVVGLCGNSLVIYVVFRYSKMQTVTNLYILNLAVADECFLIGIPFLLSTMSIGSWPFGDVICKVYMTTTSINQFTSSIFLTVMSADRYVAVCHPISSPRFRTPLISKVVSATAWIASALLIVPVIMYANTVPVDHSDKVSCNILWPDMGSLNRQTAFTLYSFVLGFAVPLVLIFVFYALVIRKLKTVGPKHRSKEKKRSHRKVTKLVLTVVTVYVVCWLPYWIAQVALIFTQPNRQHSHIIVIVYLLTGCLSYSNSAMNPILYAFLSDNFKKSFLKACTCAAGKDVNAALHLENSVFPRGGARGATGTRGGSERRHNQPATVPLTAKDAANSDDEDEHDQRSDPSTAITLTSRSNVSDAAINVSMDPHHRNGVKIAVAACSTSKQSDLLLSHQPDSTAV